MRSVALSVTLLGGWLLMSASHGEIYAWRDAAGHLQFGDKKPTGTAAAPLHVRRVNSIQAVTVEASLNAGGTQTVHDVQRELVWLLPPSARLFQPPIDSIRGIRYRNLGARP